MSGKSKFRSGWHHNTRLWIFVLVLITAIIVQGCSRAPAAPAAKEKPSAVEVIEGSDLKKVTLTQKAAERIGLETVMLEDIIPQTGSNSDNTKPVVMPEVRQQVPYAAVIYDIHGDTWVYTSPEPLTFVREKILVDHIDGEWAVLSENLPMDTRIVTVGVAELYGAETGVGK